MRTTAPSKIHDAKQAIINAGSSGVEAKRLAVNLGITWNTLKTLVSRLRKGGFAVSVRRIHGVPMYFMTQFAPPSKDPGGVRPKSTRLTCGRLLLAKLQECTSPDGVTYAELKGPFKKSSLSKAMENLKFAGKCAIGRWAIGSEYSVVRMFPTAEARDAGRRHADERRAMLDEQMRRERAQKRRPSHPKPPTKSQPKKRAGSVFKVAAPRLQFGAEKTQVPRGPAHMAGQAVHAPNAKIISRAAPSDTRFAADPRETSFLFSAMGPGRYMRHESAIARAYPVAAK